MLSHIFIEYQPSKIWALGEYGTVNLHELQFHDYDEFIGYICGIIINVQKQQNIRTNLSVRFDAYVISTFYLPKITAYKELHFRWLRGTYLPGVNFDKVCHKYLIRKPYPGDMRLTDIGRNCYNYEGKEKYKKYAAVLRSPNGIFQILVQFDVMTFIIGYIKAYRKFHDISGSYHILN